MIKINIVAVGRVKEGYYSDGIKEYLKRLSRFAEINLIEVKEENLPSVTSDADRLKIISLEGDNILKKLKGKVYPLCIEGDIMSSEDFASLIKDGINQGEELTFVIGGSYGLDKRVKSLATKKISFSKMTFPHTMFRLMLTEQIYRAFTIINNTTYHK